MDIKQRTSCPAGREQEVGKNRCTGVEKDLKSTEELLTMEFDWYNNAAVVLRAQRAIAIYRDDYGDIVIRQKRDDAYEEQDSEIVVAPANAQAFAKAILAHASEPAPAEGYTARKDRTAAERQRRYRDRHRNVTPSNSVTPATQSADSQEELELT